MSTLSQLISCLLLFPLCCFNGDIICSLVLYGKLIAYRLLYAYYSIYLPFHISSHLQFQYQPSLLLDVAFGQPTYSPTHTFQVLTSTDIYRYASSPTLPQHSAKLWISPSTVLRSLVMCAARGTRSYSRMGR